MVDNVSDFVAGLGKAVTSAENDSIRAKSAELINAGMVTAQNMLNDNLVHPAVKVKLLELLGKWTGLEKKESESGSNSGGVMIMNVNK